ncbi:MAG: fused MFS/spermidine synthase [Isosphaeraceae bacterium]
MIDEPDHDSVCGRDLDGAATSTDSKPGALKAGRSVSISIVAILYLLFFCSGMASLICETVWFKQLQFVLGSSTFSVSVVVACFFGGLALGGWLGGRRADRSHHPLRLYSLLELGLSLASVAVTLTLSCWESWISVLAPWLGPQSPLSRPLTILLSASILIVPTALMGSTLPVLGIHLARSDVIVARKIGLLYAVNTFGGATGCALVGFFLIGRLGVIQSALLASLIYLMIAVGAAVTIWLRPLADWSAREPLRDRASVDSSSIARPGVWLVLAFALMGFTSIAYEVLWFRLLTYFGIHTVYAFTGMLSTYLMGLVLGALLTTKYLARRRENHLADLARVQLLMVGSAALSLAIIGRSRNLMVAIEGLERWLGVAQLLADVFAGTSTFLGLCLVALLLPSTFIGMGLPIAMEWTTSRHAGLGSRLGLLYSVNTLGGVLGSLVVGFVLLPLLGSQGAFTAVLVLNLAVFAILVASQPALQKDRRLIREGVMGAAFLVAFGLLTGTGYLKQALTRYVGAEVLAFRESPDATFVVLEYRKGHGEPSQQLVVNGTSYANNSPPGRRYMSTLAHLPALLHPGPQRALVISIGTGTTIGSLTLHPSLERIWAVDIARDVFELAPCFVPLNHRFTESSKVNAVVADGRHFLLGTGLRFDVLTFEPPPPIEAGVVNLYSREFYRLAKAHMNRGGLLCQWIPLDTGFELLPRMMIRTMLDEFSHVSLWIPNRMEAAVVASMEPLSIDPEDLRKRMSEPALRSDLAANGLGEPEQLMATFVTADQGLANYAGPAPTVTDNQPRIEYFNLYFPKKVIRFSEILRYRQPVERYLIRRPSDPARLHLCEEVIREIWYQYEESRFGRLDVANAHLDHALELDPQNSYLLYLRSQAAN